jgi:hypothetical protein
MMLEYWREYRTYFHIGQAYGLSESAAYRNIKLAKSKAFRLPGRKAVAAIDRAFDIVLIVVTETPIERPKKIKALLLGQEEAAHTENSACRGKSTRRILCLAHEKGRRHDFRLFKRSKVRLHPETKAVVDSGYQGLQRVHANTAMPKKRSKKKPLSASDRAQNRAISSDRVPCENVITMLKGFKIIADRYPPPFRPALLPHRRNLQHGTRGRRTVMQESNVTELEDAIHEWIEHRQSRDANECVRTLAHRKIQ